MTDDIQLNSNQKVQAHVNEDCARGQDVSENTQEPRPPDDLRRQAEERLSKTAESGGQARSDAEAHALVHELQVHQIELEMQNDELQNARDDADAWLALFTDLYDFAPVGYFTLDRDSVISQLNLAGAQLIGGDRSSLVNRRFERFVSPDSRATFSVFLADVFQTRTREKCEVVLRTEDGASLDVRIEAAVREDGEECRIAVVDITERKRIEDALLFLLQSDWSASDEDFFQSLARYLGETLGMDFVCIDRLIGDNQSAQTVAIYSDGKFEDNIAYTLKDTPCGDVVGKTLCSFPSAVRDLFPKDAVLQDMKAEGYIGTTLWSSRGQPIGLIAMISRRPLSDVKSAESLLGLVSLRAAGELERRQAEEALRKSKEQVTTILNSISDAFFTLDRDWNFTYVNGEAESVLGKSSEEMVGTNIWYQFPEAVGSMFYEEYERAVREGVAVHFESYYPPFRQWFEVRAYPHADGLSVYFQDCSERRAAQDILSQSSERSAHIAEVLQNALLPARDYDISGCDIAVRYEPALKEAEVGGDFYDVFLLDEDKVGILIGDVVGKGLSAAIRVAAARHSIRSYAYLDPRPGRVLTLANEALCRDHPGVENTGALTAFFAVVDTKLGGMRYASGGHEPPVVRTRDGRIEVLDVSGQMMGVAGDFQYAEGSRKLRPKDVVVMVTDGITEAHHDSRLLFGIERVQKYLLEHRDAAPEAIAEGVLAEAKAYAGGELSDDVAIVVVSLKNG